MKRVLFLLIVSLASLYVYTQDAVTVYKNTVNSTVKVHSFDINGENLSTGSGFFVAENIIVTNFHVIENAYKAICYTEDSYNGFEIEGYVAFDKSVDLILLKVKGLNRPPIPFSTSNIVPGEKVFVIGSPQGLQSTISDGIVSALRDFEGTKLIQFTAPVSPGSSGGPVLNSHSELIGVTVASLKSDKQDIQNLNFAVPKAAIELMLGFKKSYASPLSTLIKEQILQSAPKRNESQKEVNANFVSTGFYVFDKTQNINKLLPKVVPLDGKERKAKISGGFKKYYNAFFSGKHSSFVIKEVKPTFFYILDGSETYNFLDYSLFICKTGWEVGDKRFIAYGEKVSPIKWKFERIDGNLYKFSTLEKLRGGQSYVICLKNSVIKAPCYSFFVSE